MAEQVDAADLKSVGSNPVPVRFRPSAPIKKLTLVVGFFVGIAKALDSTDAGNGQSRGYSSEHGWCDADFDEDLDMDFFIEKPKKKSGSMFGPARWDRDFEQLMTPGSNEAALFNAADDEGYDLENW